MNEGIIFREIISRIISSPEDSIDVQQIKLEVCRKYGVSAIPKHSQVLSAASSDERKVLRTILLVKPTRTLSGVAPVAVMTSPYPCPHGRCLPCPGGPDHPFHSPQSYTGEEPAARRAREHAFDPYQQVTARLEQFQLLGHHVDKAELIVMGGTMTARLPEYQEIFVRRCLQAMNEFGSPSSDEAGSFEDLARENEQAAIRCIGITFETRPDWCGQTEIDRMLSLGVTKVELGVQHTMDRILAENRRGCTVEDTITANRLLRDSGLKVGFHVMPNLPGSSLEEDRTMFHELFEDPSLRPDFLKIYPTLVTPQSEIEALWEKGAYAPYLEEDLIDLVAGAKSILPKYVRLQRIQRDIPAGLITAGSRHSNFRQLARKRMEEQGGRCACIRCREIGRCDPGEEPAFHELVYDCCNGKEYFLSVESGEALIGFARLRFPADPYRPELAEAALLRELHVYGELVPIGETPPKTAWQHRHFGEELLRKAEEQATAGGYRNLAVMSGVGVRPYYRRHGYEQIGPYMEKVLP
jgi:elongator complex protein 3